MQGGAAEIGGDGLPRTGKMPKVSRPTTSSPATASALAESPSVTISVHAPPLAVPASSASSSLAMLSPPPRRPAVASRSIERTACASSAACTLSASPGRLATCERARGGSQRTRARGEGGGEAYSRGARLLRKGGARLWARAAEAGLG